MYVETKGAVLFLGALTAIASIAACSSRYEVDASSASGAGGAHTTSTSSGAVGAGGSEARCASLALSGDPITYEATPDLHGGRPKLLSTAGDGSLASVVYYQQGIQEPLSYFAHVASATIAPWQSWPTTLGAGAQASFVGGDTFVASAALPKDEPGFSLLFYLLTNAFPSDMFLAPRVEPGVVYDGSLMGVQWDAWEPAWTVAMARGASGHLAAYEIGVGMNAYMNVALLDEGSPTPLVINELACANAPFTADVTSTTNGFLVATAAGRPFGACPLDDGIPGPPDEIQVISIDAATKKPSLSTSLDLSDLIGQIALAKRPSGAWLVYHGLGANAESPPPIMGILLDEGGAPLGPSMALSQESASSSAFAAAALGDDLLLAWFAQIDGKNPTIELDLIDAAGSPLLHTSLVIPAPFIYDPALSLLVSPDATQILVAWSDIAASGPATVRVARLSCSPPL